MDNRHDDSPSKEHVQDEERPAGKNKTYARSRELNRIFIRKGDERMSTSPVRLPEDEDKLVALIKTNEPHIRRAVERRDHWIENRNKHAG